MRILAIESTCDETAAAVVESCGAGVKVIKNVVASSVEMHEKYGGIVPEVAAREQVRSIIPVIKEAMSGNEDYLDGIAVSYGPGLMGSLLVGVETARVLSWAWNKPLMKVNHMAAHVLANWIIGERTQRFKDSRIQGIEESRIQDRGVPEMPAIGLVVSGGHTDIIFLETLDKWRWVGGTRDDAAGEAYDKTARLLGLPYPGGPEVDKAANRISEEDWERYRANFKLPRPLIHDPRLDMSFSGIKAAVARMVSQRSQFSDLRSQISDGRSQIDDEMFTSMVAREFSEAVTEVLVKKTRIAVEQFEPKSVVLAGGVAANKKLRESLRNEIEGMGLKFFVPDLKYCGDNAAMVGAAAILRPVETEPDLVPDPSLAVV